jgi:hypothetical protein
MKKMFVSIFISAAMLLFVSCATTGTNGVVQIGPDLYMIGGLGGFTDFSSSGVKARLYQTANKFCADKGCVMLPANSTGRDSGMGTYATAEIQFYCLKPNDPRLAPQNNATAIPIITPSAPAQ